MDRLERPKVVGGLIVKVTTGCGNMYIQLGWWNGSIHEVFATLGRGGGCAMGYGEALTRSVTVGLRRGVPVDDYIDQLRGVRCPNPMLFPKEDAVQSCPDALAKVLRQYGVLTIEELVKLILNLKAPVTPVAKPTIESESLLVPGSSILDAADPEYTDAMAQIKTLKANREAQGL